MDFWDHHNCNYTTRLFLKTGANSRTDGARNGAPRHGKRRQVAVASTCPMLIERLPAMASHDSLDAALRAAARARVKMVFIFDGERR